MKANTEVIQSKRQPKPKILPKINRNVDLKSLKYYQSSFKH